MIEFIQSQDLDTVIRLSDVRKIEVEGVRSESFSEQLKYMFTCKPTEYKSYDIVLYMDDNDEVEYYVMANYVQKSDAQKAVSKMFGCDVGFMKMFQPTLYKFPDDKVASISAYGDDTNEDCKQC